MKKLLLVMLVPVLVLGLFSCGKVMDADMMPFELQGSWVNANIVLVLSGNQATVYDKTAAGATLTTAVFRVEVTPTKVPVKPDPEEITLSNENPGKITFYGFDDKKRKEIAHVAFDYDKATDANTLYLYNLVRDDSAKSVLLPTATTIDIDTEDPQTLGTKYTRTDQYTP